MTNEIVLFNDGNVNIEVQINPEAGNGMAYSKTDRNIVWS